MSLRATLNFRTSYRVVFVSGLPDPCGFRSAQNNVILNKHDKKVFYLFVSKVSISRKVAEA